MFTEMFSTCTFGFGMITAVAGGVMWIMSKTSDPWLTNWVPVVLVTAFVLCICGAHCLDVSERNDRENWK